jgi:hypothetical protein
MNDMRTSDRDVNRAIRSWLHEDRHEDASRVAGAVLDQVETIPQRRAGWLAWRTPTMNKFVTIGLGAAAVVVLAIFIGSQVLVSRDGIGGPGDEPTPTPSIEGPLAGLPLLGTYQSLIKANGFQLDEAGQWDLRIDAQGLTFIKPSGKEFSPGAVNDVTAGEITFAPDFGCPTQSGEAAEGRYSWRLDGTSLIFTKISDSCGERGNALTQKPWDLKP